MNKKSALRITVLGALIFFTFVYLGLFPEQTASGSQNEITGEEGKTTIGIVHITFEPEFFFGGIQYQSFDRSYRKQWKQLSEKKGFNLIQVEGGFTADDEANAVRRLIDLKVDAILLFLHDPDAAILPISIAQEAGIPIAVHGIRPAPQVQAPYIGFSEYDTCRELGKETARLFKKIFPDQNAVVLINNSRTVVSDIEREKGFIDGFKELIPGAQIINKYRDLGTVESVMGNVNVAFLNNRDINVVYNTSDIRASGTMVALRNVGKDTIEKVIVAGVGGSEEAMRELLTPEKAWKAEVGLAVKEAAEKSYEVLIQMVNRKIPIRTKKEYLVDSEVFISPSLGQVQEYLKLNHDIKDFNP